MMNTPPPHQLQTLLHFLVSDASSITHLTHILANLSSSCLTPSPHLHKWVTRVTSLMRSKDPAARWAAMCIAYRMSFLSTSLLAENAQSWVGIIFPALSKPDPIPVVKMSIRYLTLVLCAAKHNLEFQRQIAIPIVPKVSSALLTIAENHSDRDIKVLSVRTLAQLISLYPSLHKALSQRLFDLCYGIFGGGMHHATDGLIDAAANLYAVLHFLGGKVAGSNIWRNSLDDVLQFSWSSWLTLRTTFPTNPQISHKVAAWIRSPDNKSPNPLLRTDNVTSNPLTTVALNLDRLKCGISAIGALLRYLEDLNYDPTIIPDFHNHCRVPVHRPVKVPIGHLATLCWCLLTSTRDDEGQGHFDPHARIAESAVVPQIWTQACRLLSLLVQTTQEILAPHASKLIMIISSHLEGDLQPFQRQSFLLCAYHLLYFCPAVGTTLAVDRLLRATISLLSPLQSHQPPTDLNLGVSSQPRASKKRRREYEADGVLLITNPILCATTDECDTLITALDVVGQCMSNPELAPSIRSLANRVLLSTLLSLSSLPSSSLSSNPNFHERVMVKVRDICVENVQGTSQAMSKGTSLVLRTFTSKNLMTRDKLHSRVDLLLHPRRPPLVRVLPTMESLFPARMEESAEEITTHQSLELAVGNGVIRSVISEPHTQPPESASHNPLAVVQTLSNTSREQAAPIFAGLPPTTGDSSNVSMELPTPTVVPVVVLSVPDMSTESPLSTIQNRPASSVRMAPVVVDESDHEEVPAIDLGSDSDE